MIKIKRITWRQDTETEYTWIGYAGGELIGRVHGKDVIQEWGLHTPTILNWHANCYLMDTYTDVSLPTRKASQVWMQGQLLNYLSCYCNRDDLLRGQIVLNNIAWYPNPNDIPDHFSICAWIQMPIGEEYIGEIWMPAWNAFNQTWFYLAHSYPPPDISEAEAKTWMAEELRKYIMRFCKEVPNH